MIDLVFPPRCEVCGAVGREEICDSCAGKINFLRPTAFVHSVAAYEGPIKSAIHRFKFRKREGLAEPLGIMMVKYLSRNLDMNRIDFLVPVPLHKTRLCVIVFYES